MEDWSSLHSFTEISTQWSSDAETGYQSTTTATVTKTEDKYHSFDFEEYDYFHFEGEYEVERDAYYEYGDWVYEKDLTLSGSLDKTEEKCTKTHFFEEFSSETEQEFTYDAKTGWRLTSGTGTASGSGESTYDTYEYSYENRLDIFDDAIYDLYIREGTEKEYLRDVRNSDNYAFTAGWGADSSLQVSNTVDGDRTEERYDYLWRHGYYSSDSTGPGLTKLYDHTTETTETPPDQPYAEARDTIGFAKGVSTGGQQLYVIKDFRATGINGQSKLHFNTVTNMPRQRDHEGPEDWGTRATQIKPGEPNFGNFAIVDTDGLLGAYYSMIDVEACFVAGTLIALADGTLRKIEDLQPGIEVLCRDHENPGGELLKRKIVRVFHNAPKPTVRISARCVSGDETLQLQSTGDHPFYVPGSGWIPVRNLGPGMELLGAEGRRFIVTNLEPSPDPVPVFNLEVEGTHTYYVTNNKNVEPVVSVPRMTYSEPAFVGR